MFRVDISASGAPLDARVASCTGPFLSCSQSFASNWLSEDATDLHLLRSQALCAASDILRICYISELVVNENKTQRAFRVAKGALQDCYRNSRLTNQEKQQETNRVLSRLRGLPSRGYRSPHRHGRRHTVTSCNK